MKLARVRDYVLYVLIALALVAVLIIPNVGTDLAQGRLRVGLGFASFLAFALIVQAHEKQRGRIAFWLVAPALILTQTYVAYLVLLRTVDLSDHRGTSAYFTLFAVAETGDTYYALRTLGLGNR